MEALYGTEITEMEKLLGQRDLRETVERLDEEKPGDTILYIDLEGRHPDDGFSGIPYEKGANLLLLLETHFGRERFDAFLKKYFDTFAFKTMTTEKALAYMKRELFGGDEALWKKLKMDEWVYEEGIPANIVEPTSDKFDKTRAAAGALMDSGDMSGVSKTWVTAEWLDFLNSLPEKISRQKLEALDAEHGLTRTGNSEVLFAWLMISIRNDYTPAYPVLEEFLKRVGRRKFIVPLYEAMMKNEKTRAMAERIYAEARPGYHPIAQNSLDKVVK
jgi:hypothetical protein